jgi:hypothetical protein
VVSVCAASATLTAPATTHATVEVNVTRVGFPTLERGDVVRNGAWTPLIVDLALVEQQSFDGTLRVGQLDIDGDECYDSVGVHLRAETGGTQRVYLYIPANPLRSQGRMHVELRDEEGTAVRVLSQGELTLQAQPAQIPSVIGDEDILVLSLSTGTIGRVRDVAGADQTAVYDRPLILGHMNPLDLPELWLGLEAVDYIVWDDARPEELTGRQLGALIEWVHQGGTLLLAASRTAGASALTDSLYAVLPVDLGEVVIVDNLPEVRRTLLAPRDEGTRRPRPNEVPWWKVPFDAPFPVVRCTLREGASPVCTDVSVPSDVITERPVGRGHVIFCGVVLKDLFTAPGSPTVFFQRLFHLRVVPESKDVGWSRPQSLFPYVISAVGFSAWSSLYIVAAFAFCALYLLCATFGTWGFLSMRGWTHHSWSAFAVVALVASALSVLAVNFVHGFGETLHQISVVDVDAGQTRAYGTIFFGLKTGTDKDLDMWLPSDQLSATEPGATECFLRPAPSSSDLGEASTSFADPEAYRLAPGSAVLDDVRIRATLKRLEGRWEGLIGGTVAGQISVKGLRIRDGSWIANDLNVDLVNCWLLHTTQDFLSQGGSRSGSIYAFPIGTIPSGGRKVELATRCYQLSGQETFAQFLVRSTLAKAQIDWGRNFSTVLPGMPYGDETRNRIVPGQERNALLLASTVGEYDPSQELGMRRAVLGADYWSRDRLRQLDLREQLRRDSMILIGFADDPGPARLFRRTGDRPYTMLKPDLGASWTMYRIRIPVTLIGGPSPEEEEPERIR